MPAEYKSAAEIRDIFIKYFAAAGHEPLPSGPLVPAGDPSLLFTNSGMVPFKDLFLGEETSPYKRAVTAQRCMRAGGKHNDLENVGWTARHHTFFEMLGNFSFGDYFKQQAINYAWELVTTKLGLPPDKLWVTVHYEDKEAAELWQREIGVPRNRIIPLAEDNFWQMGDTGPCGPCSEIFYDHGPQVAGDPPGGPNEGDRYIEVWNLVFMQFNRTSDGVMHPLPQPSVDTGMGLERMAAVLQGVQNNYETDLFTPLLALTNELCGGKNKQASELAAQRIIADHIRSAGFLIAEGVQPSNEGRGYVLRRIIRRALRYGNKLKIPSPFFHKLMVPLVESMGAAHPLIAEQETKVSAVLQAEEEKFNQTLEQGIALLSKEREKLSGGALPGEVVFKLYDTYGFPPDLTEAIGREQGFSLDWQGFNQAMEQQRQRSRSFSMFRQTGFKLPPRVAPTEFRGYTQQENQTKLLAILNSEGQEVQALRPGDEGVLLLAETVFYAESGGQLGDQGQIFGKHGLFKVRDTQKQQQVYLHFGKLEDGELQQGAEIVARLDGERRAEIAKHHTATHLVHAALHEIIGKSATQRGSRVAADSLRLDFSHNQLLSEQQLQEIETWVNQSIRQGLELHTAVMPLAAAKQAGAMALFGEKYGNEVRVVDIPGASKELCGGTHAANTRDLAEFIILKESAIATGVRRLEGLVGNSAQIKRYKQRAALNQLKRLLASADEESLPGRISELLRRLDKQDKELAQLTELRQLAENMRSLEPQLAAPRQVKCVPVVQLVLEDVRPAVLNQLADKCRQQLKQGLVILANKQQDRVGLLITVSKDLSVQYPAEQLLQQLLAQLGGKGGGSATRAQGGCSCPEPGVLTELLQQQISQWIEERS